MYVTWIYFGFYKDITTGLLLTDGLQQEKLSSGCKTVRLALNKLTSLLLPEISLEIPILVY